MSSTTVSADHNSMNSGNDIKGAWITIEDMNKLKSSIDIEEINHKLRNSIRFDSLTSKLRSADPIKNQMFKRFQRKTGTEGKIRNNLKTVLDTTSEDNNSQESAIDEAIEIIESSQEEDEQEEEEEIHVPRHTLRRFESAPVPSSRRLLERSESALLQRSRSRRSFNGTSTGMSDRLATELFLDNSDRLSIMMQNSKPLTEDDLSSDDESDFDE